MILITGATGQLGCHVAAQLKKDGKGFLSPTLQELDITNKQNVNNYFKAHKPSCVIHCAAYTNVDKAEDEKEKCFDINEGGSKNLALACKEINGEMIYISTDYVFSGQGTRPYETNDPTGPLSTYGKSKLAGEEAVKKYLNNYYILRTSWVFGQNGNNFVKTILRLASERDSLNIVSDQIGSPTYTVDLAKLLSQMALSKKYGIYHATNEGFCSWADFAQEIINISKINCKINSISTEEYPTKAIRPKNSRLSKESLEENGFSRLPQWQAALRTCLMSFLC